MTFPNKYPFSWWYFELKSNLVGRKAEETNERVQMQGRWIFSLHDTCEMRLGVEVQVQEDCWVFFLHDACEMRLNVQVQVQDSEPDSLMVARETVWAE